MLKFTMIGAAALLSATVTAPAFAEVISEPGAYAFYYPNADLGFGGPRPADAMASQPVRGGDLGGMRMSVRPHHAIHASTIKHY